MVFLLKLMVVYAFIIPYLELVLAWEKKSFGNSPNKEIECTEKLYELLSDKKCPRRYRMIGIEFLRRLDDFRAYLKYPELHLPHTTNCIESFNKIIRDRCKHVRTSQALKLRAVTLLRVRTTVNCNHRVFQQN